MSPAPAGMIPSTRRRFGSSISEPRTRGDDPIYTHAVQPYLKVSPAPAGMIPIRLRFPFLLIREPRTRGDDPLQQGKGVQTDW